MARQEDVERAERLLEIETRLAELKKDATSDDLNARQPEIKKLKGNILIKKKFFMKFLIKYINS